MQCAKQCLVQLEGLVLLLFNSVSHCCTSSQLLLAAIMDKLQTFLTNYVLLLTTTALISVLII